MRRIVFDRSTFLDLAEDRDYYDFDEIKYSYAFQNVLYAIMLWDEILVLPKAPTKSYTVDDPMEFIEEYGCIDATNRLTQMGHNQLDLREFYSDIKFDLRIGKWPRDNNFFKQHVREITDIIFYITLSNELDAGLVLSEDRRDLMITTELFPKNIFDRRAVIDLIDKEVMDYYKDFCKQYGAKSIKIEAPILIDYVCNYAESVSDAIKVARDISKEPMVVNFKKTMDQMEECAKQGDFLELEMYLSPIKEKVPSIVKHFRTKTSTFTLQLTPNIATGSFVPSIEKDISLNIKGLLDRKHRRHLSFLYDLALFGLMQRYDK